jgi:hypothetical protein
MAYAPGAGKTPKNWAEEEARRRESHGRTHNPHGRELGHRTRSVLGLVVATLIILMVALTVLGVLGIIDVFGPPPRMS